MNITIDTSKIFDDFNDHLNLDKNNRILFTSKFGSGKSTFLSEYFEKNSERFLIFKIYPVEYSTSTSEDIFELIKYDLIYQLMVSFHQNLTLENDDYSPILKFQFDFVKQLKYGPLFFKTLSLIDPTGKVKALSEFWDDILEKYEKFKKEHSSEEEDIWQFIFKQGEKLGNPRERDYFSILIAELLQRIKENSSPESENVESASKVKETVLIIDDIDRLDPEQIFRLFNIFSLNFGKDPILNKFGFDRVIFVCDISNIREIYKHKYGGNVDFEGYIDKFYSISPYRFDTNQFLSKFIEEFIKSFEISAEFIDTSNPQKLSNNDYFFLLANFLGILITNKQINLRTLLNTKYSSFRSKEFFLTSKTKYHSSSFPIIFTFNFLEIIFDLSSEVKSVLLHLKEKFDKAEYQLHDYQYANKVTGGNLSEIMNFCLPFILPKNYLEEIYDSINSDGSATAFLPQYNVDIKFRHNAVHGGRREKTFEITLMHEKNNEAARIYINPFQVLFDTYEKCISIGAL